MEDRRVINASEEDILAIQEEYKKEYPPFRPYNISEEERQALVDRFEILIETQNGQDTDDYATSYDNNKIRHYLHNPPEGTSILLLGVGTGREVLVSKAMGFEAVGTTLGSRNTYFGYNYLGLGETELIECLCEVQPFPAETFDIVAGFQVFEHAIAPLLFLLEQTRVLRPGGRLLLEWPPPKEYHMGDNPHHQICYTPGQARALFQKAGLGSISLYYDDLTPIPEEEWWCGNQDRMLCIEGIKLESGQDYINKARRL